MRLHAFGHTQNSSCVSQYDRFPFARELMSFAAWRRILNPEIMHMCIEGEVEIPSGVICGSEKFIKWESRKNDIAFKAP